MIRETTKIFGRSLLILLLIFGISAGQSYSQVFNEHLYKFSKVLGLVNTFYVDTVEQDELVENAIIEMLHKLDPHSIYISKEDVKAMNEPLRGNFEGIGIQFNILKDTIYVISALSGGPSEKLGIHAGDRIVEIEGENVAGVGIKNKDVADKLRGKKGTIVSVGILRRNVEDLLEFTITRDKIPIHSLDASYLINKNTGYIKINRFSASTISEFEEALVNLRSESAATSDDNTNDLEHLVLDLRGNSGGYLSAAIELADHFLESKKLIVYTEGINSPQRLYKSTSKGSFKEGKVIVLVDEGSASASEIVSGAIQDWDRGIIIGRRTFGKGLVQRQYDLPDSSMIRLTIARYFTPTGRLIQKAYDKGYQEYSRDIINRYNSGELANEDSIHFPDSLKYKTLQYERTVYGGGGIMPDIFVPLDTTKNTDYYGEMIRKGIMNTFVLNYIDKNRKKLLKEYPDFDTYNSTFSVNEDLLSELVEYAEKEGLEKNEEEFETSKDDIRLITKALIARDLWSTSEYFEIVNAKNDTYLKALELLEDSGLYDKLLTNL